MLIMKPYLLLYLKDKKNYLIFLNFEILQTVVNIKFLIFDALNEAKFTTGGRIEVSSVLFFFLQLLPLTTSELR